VSETQQRPAPSHSQHSQRKAAALPHSPPRTAVCLNCSSMSVIFSMYSISIRISMVDCSHFVGVKCGQSESSKWIAKSGRKDRPLLCVCSAVECVWSCGVGCGTGQGQKTTIFSVLNSVPILHFFQCPSYSLIVLHVQFRNILYLSISNSGFIMYNNTNKWTAS